MLHTLIKIGKRIRISGKALVLLAQYILKGDGSGKVSHGHPKIGCLPQQQSEHHVNNLVK